MISEIKNTMISTSRTKSNPDGITENKDMGKISIYDPFVQAFREVDVEVAKKFVAESKKTEAELAKMEGKKEEPKPEK